MAGSDGEGEFSSLFGLDEDLRIADREALTLATFRSHDQYNTTIYGMNDRYCGITGRRDVVFVNERDLSSRGLSMAISLISASCPMRDRSRASM
jgi:anaerobic selenocysteine-containing dehydrogenase